jgi:hypothetical protein
MRKELLKKISTFHFFGYTQLKLLFKYQFIKPIFECGSNTLFETNYKIDRAIDSSLIRQSAQLPLLKLVATKEIWQATMVASQIK